MFSKLVALALLATCVDASTPTVAPSSAPTSAPTAVPTSAPSSAPTSAPDVVIVMNNTSNNSTNNTSNTTTTVATTTTKAVVQALQKTVFVAQLKMASPAQFDMAAYIAALAKTSGLDPANVNVLSVSFEVQAQYEFTGTVGVADIEAAVAKNLAVTADKVKATIVEPTARRLVAGERRLSGTTADVKVTLDDKAAATAALTGLQDVAALGTELGSEPVLKSSGVVVSVETEIAAPGAAPAIPNTAALSTELPGVEVLAVTEGEATTTIAVETTTTVDTDESGGASPKEVVTPLVLLAVAFFNLVF